MTDSTEAFIERSESDIKLLSGRLRCLTAFIGTPKFDTLDPEHQNVIHLQHQATQDLIATLQWRVKHLSE